jgi:putative PIG3 family NAD(P)H quinone oxidoreductase
MKAWLANNAGGPEVFEMVELEIPQAKPGEALVKVKAIGINRHDVMSRTSVNPEAPVADRVLGIEIAGEIVQINDPDGQYADVVVGDHVAGIVVHGAYAEYATIPLSRIINFPKDVPFVTAASIPEAFMTAYQTLYWIGFLKKGERVLIHAAGSGVGTAAIQLARHLSDAEIIATAGRQDKLDLATKLGANRVVNYKEEDFAQVVAQETNQQGVDVILDFIGASYAHQNSQAIGVDGRWVLIGVLGGTKVPDFNMGQLMSKRVKLEGTLLSARSDQYKADLAADLHRDVIPLIADGTIAPIIDTTFDFADLPDAHRHMEADKNLGKIIVTIAE